LGCALTAAILCGQNDATDLLLTADADVNVDDWKKPGPLAAAISQENSHLIRRLLAAGASVNKSSTLEGFMHDYFPVTTTVLPALVSWGDYLLIQDIINAGAEVNASPAQINGRTAFEGAAEHGRKDMVRILLIAGAQTSGVGGEQYERALKFASENGQDSTRRLLERYKEQSWESLVDWDASSC
jgi:ankyrin repeat protein